MTVPSIHAFLHNFTTLLKHYRSVNEFTQLDVATKSGISLRTYQRIESSEAEPSLSQLFSLSKNLGFRFEEIFHFQSQVTEEQKILLHSINFLEQINEVARVGGYELNLITNKLHWTDVTKKIHEVPLDYAPDLESAINFYKSDARTIIQRAVSNCIESGIPFDEELPLVTATGKEILVVAKGRAEVSDGKTVRVYGTLQDVTLMRATESSLRNKINEINSIARNAKIGIWKHNIKSGELIWSDSLFKVFEIDRAQVKTTYQAFLELIHPEDREKVNSAYMESLKNKKPYEIVHRLRMPDGRIKWILENCLTIYDDNDEPIISKGYAIDITQFREETNI